jgi:hypothetical protein
MVVFCPAEKGNIWKNWGAPNCPSQSLCIPINSTTGYCDCSFGAESWHTQATSMGVICEATLSSYGVASAVIFLGVVMTLVFLRAVKLIIHIRKSSLHRQWDSNAVMRAVITLGAFTTACTCFMQGYSVLFPNSAYDTVTWVRHTTQSIATFCIITAVFILGSSMLLSMTNAKTLTRTSRAHRIWITTLSVVAAASTMAITALSLYFNFPGLAGLGAAVPMATCWIVFRSAISASDRFLKSATVITDAAPRSRAVLVFMPICNRIGWSLCLLTLTSIYYCACWIYGVLHVSKPAMREALSVALVMVGACVIIVTNSLVSAMEMFHKYRSNKTSQQSQAKFIFPNVQRHNMEHAHSSLTSSTALNYLSEKSVL